MNSPDLTPVHVFTVIASSVFGVQMASIIGPYIVIGIGALGGASVMTMQRTGDNNTRAFVYFFASSALAVLLTVPASLVAASLYEPIKEQWLFAPVSFGLGFLGDKWAAIFRWLGSKLNALVDAWIASRSGGQR